MKTQVTMRPVKNICCILIMLLTFLLPGKLTRAQTSVYTIQHISFGAFATGSSGGTVIISASGNRSVTGFIAPLNFGVQFKPAIFEVEAPEGTIISFTNNENTTLTGSNGGTMSVHLDDSDPVLPFNTTVSPPARTQVKMGGTLTVGSTVASPPGNYSGTIQITFNYQ